MAADTRFLMHSGSSPLPACLVERLTVVADYFKGLPWFQVHGGADLLHMAAGSGGSEMGWLLRAMGDVLRKHGEQLEDVHDALDKFPVQSIALICPCPAHVALSRPAWNAAGPILARKAKRAGLLKRGGK